MTPPPDITADTTISQIFDASPEAGAALRSRGIDSCCSGSLSLRQAAEARGLPLAELLAAVRASLPAAGQTEVCPTGVAQTAVCPAPKVTGADTIRAILARHPQTADVFEKFGLMGCGGSGGPDERIDFFARMHRVDGEALVADLNDAVARGPEAAASTSGPARAPVAPVYPPFLKGSIWCTLTLGATFGASNLYSMYNTTYEVPVSHHHIHALFQIWGFVLLFIMGVSYHATPRFFGAELVWPRLARATFWMILAGILLQTWGHFADYEGRFANYFRHTLPALGVGAALIVAGVACWAGLVGATWVRAGSPRDASNPFLTMGTLWWVTAAALLGIATSAAVSQGHVAYATRYHEAIYGAALFGGTLAWIQGMFLRSGPIFLGLRPTRSAWVIAALLAGQAGALGTVVGALALSQAWGGTLQNAGILSVALSIVAFVLGVRPFEGNGGHFTDGDRGFVRVVRLGFAASLLFVLIGGAYATSNLAEHSLTRLTWDGARHAYTLGFVTLLIFGMASRIVPIFGGAPLQWPLARTCGAWLIVVGILLREAEVAAMLHFEPWLMNVAGASGIVGGLGVILMGASLLKTLRAAGSPGPLTARPEEVPISGEANVAALVTAHPEALPILIEAGLTPLANPVLRNTMARMVTLERGCKMHGIDLEAALAKIRAACPHKPAAPRAFSV